MKRGIAALVGAGLLSCAAAPDFDAAGRRWWAHVVYLASDELAGRDTGSEGYRRAAGYVAEQFEKLGLDPAGEGGWFQPVRLVADRIVEEESSVALVNDGHAEPLKLGDDAMLGVNPDTAEDIEAPGVFIGYGIHAPDASEDDVAGVDLHGKLAVFLSARPPKLAGPLAAHLQSSEQRWRALHDAGAVGMIRIPDPRAMDIPWSRAALSRFNPSMTFAVASMRPITGLKLSMTMNPASADKLLAGTGHDMAALLNTARAGQALPHFALKYRIRAHVTKKQWELEAPNVIGMLPGGDPKLRDQYVVMSAHLDHLGVGRPIDGDAIYNGAMDDASGVASVLEIARELRERAAPLKRSVLFLAVTGEEKGELGSQYFAAHPTVQAVSIVADINLDMYLPLFPLRYVEVQGLTESTLGDTIRKVAAADGVEVQADKEPQRNLFIRSDQYSFVKRGVPALAFKFGYLPGSPEEKITKEWLRTRYHAPSDDVNQPVDKAAAARFNEMIAQLVAAVADADERPAWKPASFFARFVGK